MTDPPRPSPLAPTTVAILGGGTAAARHAVELAQSDDRMRIRVLCPTTSDEDVVRESLRVMVETRAYESRRRLDEVAAHARRIEVLSGPVRNPDVADILIDADERGVRSWARVAGVVARQATSPVVLLDAPRLDLDDVVRSVVLPPDCLAAISLFPRSGPMGAAEIATTPETGSASFSAAVNLMRITGRVVMRSRGSTGVFVAEVRSAFAGEVVGLLAAGTPPNLVRDACEQQGLPSPPDLWLRGTSHGNGAADVHDVSDRLFLRVTLAALDAFVRGDVVGLQSADVGLRWGFGARFGLSEAIDRLDSWRGGLHGVTMTSAKLFSSPSSRFRPPSVIGAAARNGRSLRASIEFGAFGS